jgi:hypothetical protein
VKAPGLPVVKPQAERCDIGSGEIGLRRRVRWGDARGLESSGVARRNVCVALDRSYKRERLPEATCSWSARSNTDAIATVSLGAVQRLIGAFDERWQVDFGFAARIVGDPGAYRNGERVAVDDDGRAADAYAQTLGDGGKKLRVLAPDDRSKFFAAIAKHRVGFPDGVLQSKRHGADHFIAHFVAEPVVDLFEMIDIE